MTKLRKALLLIAIVGFASMFLPWSQLCASRNLCFSYSAFESLSIASSIVVTVAFLCVGMIALWGNRARQIQPQSLIAVVACALVATSTSAWDVYLGYTRIGRDYGALGAYVTIGAGLCVLLALIVVWFMEPVVPGREG